MGIHIGPSLPHGPVQQTTFRPQVNPKQSFLQRLHEAGGNLQISRHAAERLAERNIRISETEWKKVGEKVFEAKNKGVKESLVLLEQAALIISAKNATVITAMDRQEAKEQIFTNIDGTIVLN
ncbi:TIGR02530 family flagellar biosynthesis protein [Indiicoccus explosivorum]|uniref:TIGR02530 family flagellar biosynthesis protein n=1 Tax=Indiicoccus explosivorum TaxID=1917864 RepID=UPI000B439C27|nr:TIGR02530 family flagellar biosynthesis protein [Indiicoccus explosivorum]